MTRILCVEDNKEFQIYLSAVLKEYSLTHASTLAEALRLVEGGHDSFDLILLDVSLPDGNGMRVLPQLKEGLSHKMTPIIVVSADNDILSKVAAFGVGADDYISKPPDPSELKARIEARLRWLRSQPQDKSRLEYGDLVIDSERMSVEIVHTLGRRLSIELTPFEFKILRLLTGRPGQVFSRDHIIERVWGIGRHITSRTVDAHVSHLRRKLLTSRSKIETVLSAGYKISLKDNEPSSETP